MGKKIVSTDNAPGAIGPYSQGVKADGFVFLSGQIPIDPTSGDIVAGGITEQTRRVLENFKAVLEAAGSGMDHVVKTTVYLSDMNHFAKMNEVYGEYLGENSPARATVEVARLPKDVLIEIDMIATCD